MGYWSVVGWSAVDGSVVGGFNKTLFSVVFFLLEMIVTTNYIMENDQGLLRLIFTIIGTKY